MKRNNMVQCIRTTVYKNQAQLVKNLKILKFSIDHIITIFMEFNEGTVLL